MRKLLVKFQLFFALFIFCHNNCFAQPLWTTKQVVNEIVVFKDIKNKNKYYYGPHRLELAVDANGKPIFQLISMRYTGTQKTGDKGEKRFTNLLQFSVSLPPVTAEDQKNIRHQLQLPASAQLVPISINNIDAMIVSGLGEGINDNKLRKRAETQSETTKEKGVFWTERSFVMPLDNHEAQILWDQYQNERVAVSLNYTFYADVVQIKEVQVQVSGDSAFVETIKDAVGSITKDTVESAEIIESNVLNIMIDVKKYPDALKHIDINENSIPPAYPALEVKCYDFYLDVRPDLAYKRVFVEGSSINGQQVQEKIKFSSGQKDITTQFVSFRFAIRMDQPMRYKVVEYMYDGNIQDSKWTVMEPSANLIDASTPQKKNPLRKQCIDVEILPEYLDSAKLAEVAIHFVYHFAGKEHLKTLSFTKAEKEYFKSLCLSYESEKPFRYFILRTFTDGTKSKGYFRTISKDDYILITD